MTFDSLLVANAIKVTCAIAILAYASMAAIFFSHWLKALYQDPMMDADEMFVSKLMLAIATLFWPVVVPFCYLELSAKFQRVKRRPPLKSDSR
ncbi:MAG: hypothetical protein F6K32_14865 [Desertifilum sp. SIO1I2]|nr:hypothetical protein [Desertifilum sp. SIO1I2]